MPRTTTNSKVCAESACSSTKLILLSKSDIDLIAITTKGNVICMHWVSGYEVVIPRVIYNGMLKGEMYEGAIVDTPIGKKCFHTLSFRVR